MTMRERMARALAERNGNDWAEVEKFGIQNLYYLSIDAILDAMEEPTPEVFSAAMNEVGLRCHLRDGWRSMISQIKKG